jgi:hypothetical protein
MMIITMSVRLDEMDMDHRGVVREGNIPVGEVSIILMMSL